MIGTKERKRLIDRIKKINDKDVFDEISRLLEVDLDDSIYITSDQQKKGINEAQKQINKGKGIPSERADREIDEWLEK